MRPLVAHGPQNSHRSPLATGHFFLLCALCGLCASILSSPSHAQVPLSRPPITGIAHVRLYSTDLYKSREFYAHILGLGNGTAGCMAVTRPCFTVNDHQQIELIQVTGGAPDNLLAEVAFATPDAEQMRRYLTAHHISAGEITKDRNGVQHFELKDPEGLPIAFVQLPSQHFFTAPPEQVSTHLVHAGFIVKNRAVEDHFYRDILGFRMYWHGGFKDVDRSAVASEKDNDWWEIQVPDGSDWVEFMLNIPANADHNERGIQNHFSFAVEQIKPTAALLRTHGLKSTDEPEIGRDGKWSWDIYDPDATRVEFMEFKPAQEPCCNPYTASHPKP
jgi:catechol 2,3-dioxygenase-like lactoylglutathione lyase family enzyme